MPPLQALLQKAMPLLRQRRALPWLLALLVATAALLYMKYALAVTYTVNTTADTAGSTCSGTCSLRQAITAANAAGAGPHTININISGCSSGCTISLGSNLPDITRAVYINGTAQSGYSGAPLIRISGNDARDDGLVLAAGSSGSTIRGLVISRFNGYGVRVIGSDNNVIAGNYLGTDLDGLTASGNYSGVWVTSGSGNRVGGTTAADRNVVAGNNNNGVSVGGSNGWVQGNYIGVAANGSTAVGNSNNGIWLGDGASSNRIGGVNAGEANLIANNGNNGVMALPNAGSGNSLLGNSIHSNGARGIDLENDGISNNDGGDGDSGPNGLQNFPVLSSAVTNTVAVTVVGTLNSNASTNYRIEFFNNSSGDSSGYGEGQTYLGSTSVTTNGSGNASFSLTLSGVSVAVGHKVSAIATVDLGGGNYGSSSEFASNATATLAPAGINVGALSGNTTEAGGTATFTVVLNRAPTANVTIPVSSSNTIEGTVSTALLTFTTANWFTPQTVTVTGQDDTLADGDRAYTVVLGAATSSDGAYNGQNPADVAVTNTDNDNQNTVVVTTNSDVVDGTTTSLYALLSNKGADGQISLREAITAANATANGSGGPDIINFAVGSGSFSISLGSSLPALSQPTFINGWSQTGYTSTPLVIIDCNQLGAIGIRLNAAALGSTVRGLVIRDCSSHAIQIDASSNGNTIQGNYLGSFGASGTDQGAGERNVGAGIYVVGANNTIGGSSATTRNVIGGNQSHGVLFSGATATGNLLQGNYIGLNAAGTAAVANSGNGVMLDTGAANNVIGTNLDGNNDTTEGNVVSGNSTTGIQLWGAGSGNAIRGNLIGVNPAASATLPNLNMGIQIGGATTNATVGGTTAAAANTIGGNPWNALEITSAGSTGHVVQGNYIGTNSGGVLNLGNGGGVAVVGGAASNTIGGTAAGAGNLVAYTGAKGLVVSGAGTGNALLGNSIHSNGGLGIDLADNGVTANDSGDGDTGANNLQNFPVLTLARTNASNQLILSGTLNSTANSYFRIEFFANTTGDASNYGQGQTYLGFANVATNGAGNATISTTLAVNVAVGSTLSATATKSNAGYSAYTDSSEFSRNIVAISSTQATVVVDTISTNTDGDTTSLSTLLANKGADGFISLREAITAANNTTNGSSGPDRIHFNIAGAGPHFISPGSALPAITQPVVIDGSTEPDFATNGNRPVVVLNGNNVVADGLVLASGSGGSTVRGLVIRDFAGDGIEIQAGSDGNTIVGNYIGALTETGVAMAGEENTGDGIRVLSANNTVGGTTAADRNVIAGNSGAGIVVGGNNTVVQGNYVGLLADGATKLANGSYGINVLASVTSASIGSATAGAGNVVSGNGNAGILFEVGSSGSVKGNLLGTDATGNTVIAGNGAALFIATSGLQVGGTTSAEANTFAGSNTDGIIISGAAATGNAILGNRIHSNSGLGLDLADNGVTANDTGDADTGANNLQNYPVLASAVLNAAGTQITISGSLNSTANAYFRIEFFASTTGDASGYGEGQRLIGSANVATDGSGNATINSTLTVVVAAGEAVTATATKSNAGYSTYTDTSEFAGNVVAVVPTFSVSGTVYEDVNYGGGAGRTLAASAGAAISGATVELYNPDSGLVASTTTNGSGTYTFTGVSNGGYFVRVVQSTVRSTRSGNTAALRAVQTWRYEASWLTPAAITNEVGGARPDTADSSAAATLSWTVCAAQGATCTFTGTRLVRYGFSPNFTTRVATDSVACNNGIFGDPAVGVVSKDCAVLQPHLHSASSVQVAGASASGVDFGFNFSTVTNVNDSGAGSLRQAITNANTLADTGLAQSGRTAGIESLVFMISNGTTGSGGSLGLSGGLRAGISFFSSGVATVTPTSTLPTLSTPMVVDAQAQPGWTANPLVHINGAAAGGGNGLTLTGGNSVLRGLNVYGYAGAWGIYISGSSANSIEGCWVGLNAAGTAAAPTAQGVWIDSSTNNVVGGSTSAKRNVLSGNTSNGLVLNNATGTQIKGNYIGLNAAGTAAVGNGDSGIVMLGNSTGTVIGGTVAGEGNVIAGNTGAVGGVAAGVSIQVSTATGSVIRGNVFGMNAAQSAPLASVGYGIYAPAANTTIGGTAAGAGNVITAHSLDGVAVTGAATSAVSIQGNSIYANGGNGIDLADNGATANDGAKTAGQPNLLMDAPVFTSATLSGTTLTVTGYVGSAAGQSAFATSRVEVFVSDASSGFGQGQTYLGFVVADASGNFSGAITGVTGATIGSTQITGTATDGSGNTSEFGANATIGWGITGTVFEDVNYGGGAGRSQATAAGVGLAGATVELYSAAGVWVRSTTTASGGSYSFMGLTTATYQVRVVGATVQSQRGGSPAGLLGVMTYRTTAASGTAVPVTDQVGGTTPALADPAAGSAGATFNTSTGVFSAVLAGTALHFAPVAVGTAIVGGVDFGFNFSTVVNTNASGTGSLRQALLNANALTDDGTLAVAGRSAATEHIIFMLADGTTRPGLRNTFASQFAAGVATITPTSALPTITSTLVLDAQTQPGWVQDPIIELRGNAAGAVAGLTLNGGASTVRGLIINRYGGHGISITGGAGHTLQGCWVGTDATGAAAAANTGDGVSVVTTAVGLQIGGTTASQRNVISGNSVHGMNIYGGSAVVVQGNYVGTNAAGTAAVANTARGVWLDVAVTGATVGGTVAGAGNLISGNGSHGLYLSGGAITVQGNYIGTNAAGSGALPNANGLYVDSGGHQIGGTVAAARNVVSGNTSRGIWLNAGASTVQGNYVGTNAAGTAALPNSDGIYAKAANNVIGGSAAGAGNLVSGNSAAGVLLHALADGTTVRGNTIGRNASGAAALPNNIGVSVACSNGCSVGGTAAGQGNVISGNTTTGVTVSAASQGNAILGNSIYGNGSTGIDLNANGTTLNDGAKTAGAGNQLMDHPVFTSARARGNQLTVAGYVGTAAGQSLFANARVEVFASDQDASGYGEGQTYLGSVTTDASGNFNATFTMTQSLLAVGTRLTGTATDTANNTSEFGANFSGLVVDLVVNHNGDAVDANPGDGLCQTATPGQCTLRAALMEVNALAVQPSPLTVAFALPGCSTPGQAACIITPPTALPAISKAATIDGQTQSGWVLAPLVELVGSSAPAGTVGLQINTASSAVRGLVLGGFNKAGIAIAANGVVLQGNVIGLQADGNTPRGNGVAAGSDGGVLVSSGTGVVIGGNTAAQRNVLSGNGGSGLWVDSGTVTVQGNYIGTNAAGSAAAGNGRWGVHLSGGTGHLIGGPAAGVGNVVSGNASNGTGGIYVQAASVTIQGNRIGSNAAGNAFLPNGDGSSSFASGIDLRSGSGHMVGGPAAGEANVIAGNQGHGIRVTTQTSRISANSITGNLWRGIDLAADNVTANDGSTSGAQPNKGMDHPVITGAGIDGPGTGITVFGHIGTGTGQPVFAGARVEIFKATNDGSGYGQGATYLGYLTADANGRFYGTLAIAPGAAVVGDAITGTATDTAGNSSEFGPNWTSTTTAGLSPASFNAFETDTTAGALTGVIRSKVAGTAATLAVLALDSAGTAPHSGFTGSVQLNWLDARDDSGANSGSCRASWLDLGAAGTATFSNNNRVDVAVTPPATATKAMRLKMTYAGPGGTVVACSNDAFAALPAQLAWLGASDADSATAGTTRTLDNTAASGGVVHQAGRPFTLRAQALTSGGVLMPAYDGTPALAISSCVQPAACMPGTLGGGAVSASAGLYTHSSVTYSEVGAVAVALTDTSYGNVDSGDTAAGARTVASTALAVGRFVPDSYAVTVSTNGVLGTANAACLAPGSGATFNGQGFGWATTPQVTVTARNAAGATTLHWTGSLMKLAPGAGLVPSLAVANAGSATLAASYAATTVQDLGAGQARLQAGALDRFVLDTPASAPQPSTTPTWQWQLAITDSAEAGTAGNPQPSAIATQASVLFDQGGSFHSGRLALATAHGDARSGVRMLMQLQRYTAAGWVTMTEDRGCVTVQRSQLEMDTPSGVFVGAGVCAAPLAASATTAGGRAWLALPATPGGAPGRLAVRVAGTAASGSACSPAGAVQAVASLGQPWLTGGSSGAGPQATATWGRPQRDLVLRREIW